LEPSIFLVEPDATKSSPISLAHQLGTAIFLVEANGANPLQFAYHINLTSQAQPEFCFT
jgi:hypothetical protein